MRDRETTGNEKMKQQKSEKRDMEIWRTKIRGEGETERWRGGEGRGERERGRDREGEREMKQILAEWRGEAAESNDEGHTAPGRQKTIVSLLPTTHFTLKQQISFTQLISTHWLCCGCVKGLLYPLSVSLCLFLFPSLSLSLFLSLSGLFFPLYFLNIALPCSRASESPLSPLILASLPVP